MSKSVVRWCESKVMFTVAGVGANLVNDVMLVVDKKPQGCCLLCELSLD
jgi:hypothetical protein